MPVSASTRRILLLVVSAIKRLPDTSRATLMCEQRGSGGGSSINGNAVIPASGHGRDFSGRINFKNPEQSACGDKYITGTVNCNVRWISQSYLKGGYIVGRASPSDGDNDWFLPLRLVQGHTECAQKTCEITHFLLPYQRYLKFFRASNRRIKTSPLSDRYFVGVAEITQVPGNNHTGSIH